MAKHKKGKKPAEKPQQKEPQQKVCKLEAHAHNPACTSPTSQRRTSCTKPVHDHYLDPCVYE